MSRPCCPPSRKAQRPTAGVGAVRGLSGVLGALLIALSATSPTDGQQLGDFGRMQRSFVNDEVLPLVDRNRRGMNGKAMDGFHLADVEVEMRDRVWRFLYAPHARDWAWPYTAEIRPISQRPVGKTYEAKYYKWLAGQRYASSRVRYNTIADHVGADIGTLPATFRAICGVIETDRQRQVAVAELYDLEPEMRDRQLKRDRENGAFIDRFVLALNYRYESYGYALDHLLVETPHTEAVNVDAALTELAIWVDRANAQDFCGNRWSLSGGQQALPSRVLLGAPDEGSYRK
jgi:hypothetical protein